MRTQLHLVDKEVFHNMLLVVVGIILLNMLIHDCQKILEMDCLIDQLGQSKKAKQGPLKVQIIHLEMDRYKDEP